MKNNLKKELKKFLYDIVVSSNNVSAKRAITLVAAITLIICSFLIPTLLAIVIFTSTKGDLELIKVLAATLQDIIEKNFYLVMAGLGLISSVDIAAIIKSKSINIPNVTYDENLVAEEPKTTTEVKGDDVTVLKEP